MIESPAGAGTSKLERILKSRTTWLGTCVFAAMLAVGLVVTAQGPEQASSQPSASPTDEPIQDTLLIQVRGEGDLAADNMIAGTGGTWPDAQVLAASRIMVDVPGSGQMSLAQSARQLNRLASQQALSDLLAVRIDGTISLARLALAAMVDYVGGITVTVDRQITRTDPRTGEQVVVVPAGTSQLNGTQAAAYALTWLPDEPESARLARFSDVITQTISTLPDDRLRVEQMLTSLGGSARTTASTTQTAGILLGLRDGILQSSVRELPTTSVPENPLSIVRIDLGGADQVVEELLPDALLPPSEASPRIQVRNGVGTAGLGAVARERLVRAGMIYINAGNADELGQATTRVLVPSDAAEARQLGIDVARVLRVPEGSVQVSTTPGQVPGDALVILGRDFVGTASPTGG